MSSENEHGATSPSIPEWAVHISQVYAWAEKSRPFGGKQTKRTIQWYSSSGLIPSPQRIGKEAYYDKREIFKYIRTIEILNRKFGLLLSEIHDIICAVRDLADRDTGEIILETTDNMGEHDSIRPITALANLLEEYLEYEWNEASQCDSTIDGPNFTPEQESRLHTLESEILKRLRGGGKKLEALVTGRVLQLEKELFPKGKGAPESGEVPF